MNKYIHVINADGRRITSVVINILTTEEKALEQAKSIAPDCVYIDGGDDMLNEFLAGKIYLDGQSVDAPVIEYLSRGEIKEGQVVVIRNEGPKGGPGMPEMLKPTSALMGSGLGSGREKVPSTISISLQV